MTLVSELSLEMRSPLLLVSKKVTSLSIVALNSLLLTLIPILSDIQPKKSLLRKPQVAPPARK